MSVSTGRLSLAFEVQSFARLRRGCAPTKSEAPAATGVAVPVCEAETRGLSTLTALTNEGADVAKSTRGTNPVDRLTRISGVKITPPTHADPVPTTHTVA